MKKVYLILFITAVFQLKSQLSIDLESGVAAFGYNDVRIPGNTGTAFSLSNDFKNDPAVFFRARIQLDLNKRHSLLALYAPLTIKGSGTTNEPIEFDGVLFNSGTAVNTSWKFNSYRLTYQYNVVLREKFKLALGVTAKVRDAAIGISSFDVSSKKTNIGVVPLVRFYLDWNFVDKMHLIVDGDALAAPQGRAEDVLIALQYQLIKPLKIKIGYRLLEGGADNVEVYNFSAVHYGVIGATFKF